MIEDVRACRYNRRVPGQGDPQQASSRLVRLPEEACPREQPKALRDAIVKEVARRCA